MMHRILFTGIIALLLLPAATHAQSWDSLNTEGIAAYQKGEFRTALELEKLSLGRLEVELGTKDKNYVLVLCNIALLSAKVKDMEGAVRYYQRALNIKKETSGENNGHYAIILNKLAMLYDDNKEYNKAEPLYKKALDIKAALPPDQVYADILGNVAALYRSQYKYPDAERYYKLQLDMQTKVSGDTTADRAIILNRMGTLYLELGKYPDAENVLLQSLAINAKLNGEDHFSCAGNLHNLGRVCYNKGDYKKAEVYFKRSLEIKKKAYGENTAQYGATISVMAQVYEKMGSYHLADSFYVLASETAVKLFGENNADVATSLNNLGNFYFKRGNYKKADTCLNRALRIRKGLFSDDNIEVAYTRNSIANLYSATGEYKKAEELYLTALEVHRKVLGNNNPTVATVLDNLASLYHDMGEYRRSEQYYLESLEIRKKTLGENHADYAVSLNNLAVHYDMMGDYPKAESYYMLSLGITARAVGENNPDYASSLNNIALFYDRAGNYEQAEAYYMRALNKYREVMGPDNISYAITVNNVGSFYFGIGNYTKAEQYYREAMDINRKVLGEDHPNYAHSLDVMAVYYNKMRKYKEAEENYKRSLDIAKRTLGDKNSTYANTLDNLAVFYKDRGEYDKARPLYELAMEIRKNVFGENHKNYALSLFDIATLYRKTGEYARAEQPYKRSLEITRKALGDNHPDNGRTWNALAGLYDLMGKPVLAEDAYRQSHDIVIFNINRNYSFLSEKEKEKYNNTTLYMYEVYSGFVYRNYANVPACVVHGYNNLIASSSLLLRSNIDMQRAVKSSGNDSLQKLYADWTDLRKRISFAYGLSVAEREKAGTDIPSMQVQADAMEKKLVKGTKKKVDKSIGYADVRKALGSTEAIVEFSGFDYFHMQRWTDSTFYTAYIIRASDTMPVYIPLFEEKQLKPLLAAVHSDRGLDIEDKPVVQPDTFYHALYDLVWKKLDVYLKGISDVYIVPSGLLHKLSFESIKDGDGNYLLNRYRLHHVLGGGEVVELKEKEQVVTGNDIALFGGARFDIMPGSADPVATEVQPALAMRSFQRSGAGFKPWNYLPGTLSEVQEINKTLSGKGWNCKMDTGTFATAGHFISASGNAAPTIIHIATHGFYLPPPPDTIKGDEGNSYKSASNPLLRSGLIFTGANYKWVQNKTVPNVHSGIVTAMDISNLDLTNTDLVALSACETGLGDIQSGEGVYGLQRAFRLAGAERMIISLWQVPDKETAEMMGLFYSALATGNTTYYDAFNTAQKKMQQTYPAEPLKWAAFELVGQ